MKRPLHLICALLTVLLILPEISLIAQASDSNPIMIIRCRNLEVAALKGDQNNSSQSKMMDGCPDGYEATDDGGCEPMCPSEEGIVFTYNPETGLCEEADCVPISGSSETCFSYCPTFLDSQGSPFCEPCSDIDDGSITDLDVYFNENGTCYKTCFDGDITFDLPTVTCDSPDFDGNVQVNLCFKSADETMPLQDGQFVPISDLQNCLDFNGSELIAAFDNVLLNEGQNLGFGPASGGKICIEFSANPNEPIIVNLSNQTTPLEIPTGCDPIPTMGQWALMILALLLSSLGLVFIARRKMA